MPAVVRDDAAFVSPALLLLQWLFSVSLRKPAWPMRPPTHSLTCHDVARARVVSGTKCCVEARSLRASAKTKNGQNNDGKGE